MDINYKVFKKHLDDECDIIFFECPDIDVIKEETHIENILDAIENEILSDYPENYGVVDTSPGWLNHDYARILIVGINKLAKEERTLILK